MLMYSYKITTAPNKEGTDMTKYIARLKGGKEIVKTSNDLKNRLDFYNWIVANKLGKVEEIICRPY